MTSTNSLKFPGENVEDCRDFLRTGRCKYGASCKFNHPPNVQSGGGMKAPLDPSEPLFPVRPNEPVCQYYVKHGTCKFGQACKFHHPPQTSISGGTVVGSNAIFIPRGNDGVPLPQHILLNPVNGGDQSTSTMMLQFLPQRPDEPDCIYFLRNGTCKYGATCRYHHPVNNRKSIETQRRQQQQVIQLPMSSDGSLRYAQSQHSFPPQGSRVVSTSGGTHLLVTETPIHVVPVTNGGAFQPNSGGEHGNEYSQPGSGAGSSGMGGLSQDHASSSSSIASSYETASSSLEHISQVQGNWIRPPIRNSSGGSLNAYGPDAQQSRQHGNRVMAPSASESARRLRAASFGSLGSASEHSGHDAVIGWSSGSSSLPVHQEQYEDRAGYAFEEPRLHYLYQSEARENRPQNRDDSQERESQEQLPAIYRPVPIPASRPRHSGDYVDHGLSMMTSALLNMLDTPEEAAAKSYPSRISSSSTMNNSTSTPTTPRSTNIQSPHDPAGLPDQFLPRSMSNPVLYHQDQEVQHKVVYTTSIHPYETSSRDGMDESSIYGPAASKYQESEYFQDVDQWSPAWQGQHGQSYDQSKTVLHREASTGPSSPQNNIGLYLP